MKKEVPIHVIANAIRQWGADQLPPLIFEPGGCTWELIAHGDGWKCIVTLPNAKEPDGRKIPEFRIRCGDIVQLEAKSDHGAALIRMHGEFWKVKSASDNRWFLDSVSPKDQGNKKLVASSMHLYKDQAEEHHVFVVNVCPFPSDFDYRKFKRPT